MSNAILEHFDEVTKQMRETIVRKNHDYAGDEDPYKNFRLAEQIGVCTLEKAILVRMCDKMSRIGQLIDKESKVKDEAIEDTLIDLANYSIILAGYLKNKRGKK